MKAYSSPAHMRSELKEFVPDPEFLDRMIAEYFRDQKPAPVPVHAPIGGHRQPRSLRAACEPAHVREERLYRQAMQHGSKMLAEALEAYALGNTLQTPDSLIWKSASGADTGPKNGRRETVTHFEYAAPQLARSGPCFRCGAARGCKH